MAAGPLIVGVDGSDESMCALEWAAREAERHSAPLHIVSATPKPPRMHAENDGPPTVATELRHSSVRTLEAAVTRAREIVPGLVIEADLLAGAPAVAVAEAGAGALMVVVGARGVGGFTALLLGSVSRYVAMHAPCPVVVVREQTDAVQREIVVGVRDTSDSTGALTFAFEEAARRGAELVALHAGHVSAEVTSSLSDTLIGWRDKYPAVAVRPDVVPGHPAAVLAEYSARADLVVLGRHGASDRRPAIGSIQHAVLHHARGPVAIIPER
jgi:nucleotide-binding universal stress UspA family protein